jgi:hypothetical protein
MRRFILLVALPGAAACASSGSQPDIGLPEPSERVVATDNTTTYRTTVAPTAKVPIAAPVSKVFDALKSIYSDLGIPVAVLDPATGRIGNTDFSKSQRLGKTMLSTYFNCGNSIVGPAADNYRVYISMLSMVSPSGTDGSVLETALTAAARNMEGTATDKVICATTGKLEQSIREQVERKLGLPSR